MELNYNVTGNERKALVKVISETTGEKAVYKFTPTYNYEIGELTVTRYGILIIPDGVDGTAVIEALSAAGFEYEAVGTEETETDKTEATTEPETEEEPAEEPEETSDELQDDDADNYSEEDLLELTVELPLEKVAVGNLTKLLEAKGSLIKEALGVDDLSYEIREDRIAFPWFKTVAPDEARAYTHFIAALCKMAKEAKRVTAKDTPVDNPKYAFRCFLLRLGFIGAEYKADRKILLKNLSGNSSWKNGKGGAGDEISE